MLCSSDRLGSTGAGIPSNSESLERTSLTSFPVAVWILYIVIRFLALRLTPGMQIKMARCGLVSKILAKKVTTASAPMSIGPEAISNTISSPSFVAEKSNVCSSPESPEFALEQLPRSQIAEGE